MTDTVDETIVLIGGPADGLRLELWLGGDVVEYAPKPQFQFTSISDGPLQPDRHERVVYRRSLKTRSRFVYQP